MDIIPLITHELAHVLTLTNRLEGAPEAPLAIARLYFARVDHGCDYRPAREVLADLFMLSVFGDAGLGEANYWQNCVSRDAEEALGVVRTALAGGMPAWLAATYQDDDGNLDLELVWSHVKAEGDPSPVMRDLMRSAFGGLCRSDALWNSAIRIPWRDGGCVPQAPPGLSAVAAVDGTMAVSWQAPDDDGGARVTGYTVRWKSGAQEYDTSREASVTDLADPSHTIGGLSHGVDYTIRVLASNINGDGAAAEVTRTAVGSEAALATLTLAGATLYPTFHSATAAYGAVTGHAATQITVAATAAPCRRQRRLPRRRRQRPHGRRRGRCVPGDPVGGRQRHPGPGDGAGRRCLCLHRDRHAGGGEHLAEPAGKRSRRGGRVNGRLHHRVPGPMDHRGHAGRGPRRRAFLAADWRRPQRRGDLPRKRREGQPGRGVHGGSWGNVDLAP